MLHRGRGAREIKSQTCQYNLAHVLLASKLVSHTKAALPAAMRCSISCKGGGMGLHAVAATSFSFQGIGYAPCAIPITPYGVGITPQGINIQPAGLYLQPTGALLHSSLILAQQTDLSPFARNRLVAANNTHLQSPGSVVGAT